MGSNPAAELREIFRGWDGDDGSTAFQKRGEPDNESTDRLWRSQTRASALLHQLQAFIEFTDEPEAWADFLRDAWDFVYLPREDWGATPSALPPTPRNVKTGLVGLSNMIGSTGLPTAEISAEDLASIRETLQQIEQELGAVPQKHREYVDDILLKIRECLRLLDGEPTSADLRAARERSFQITGEALYAVNLVPEDRKKTIFSHLMSLTGYWLGGTITGASGGVLTSVLSQVLQLPQ